MRIKLIKFSMIAMIIVLTISLIPVSVFAAAHIDTEKSATLELCYQHDNQTFENVDIKLYRVADVSSDGVYTLTGAFSEYQVKMNDIADSTEWKETASTLAAYTFADSIAAEQNSVTDSNGKITFSSLKVGLYLVVSEEVAVSECKYIFDPFLISVPSTDENDQWVFDVTAAPKSEVVYPNADDKEYKVVKLWNEYGNKNSRPKSIRIEILKDGEKVSEQILSKDNNWSYSWTAVNDGSVWQAVERDVPSSYTVKVRQSNNIITITNTLNTDNHDGGNKKPPYTGDDTNIGPYIILVAVCGIGLIIVGTLKLKKDEPYEEK